MVPEVAFADRLPNILSLATALTQTSDNPQKDARELEQTTLSECSSANQYHQVIKDTIHRLQNAHAHANSTTRSAPIQVLNLGGPTIGKYRCATYHANGLCSTIMKALPEDVCSSDLTAYQPGLIALKITHPSTATAPHAPLKEARSLEAAKHEHVIELLDIFWEPSGDFVMVFPFMDTDVDKLMRSDHLSKELSVNVVAALFSALAHIHALHMIHRDVKPSNILYRPSDQSVRLADFGIVWRDGDSASEPASKKITDVGTTSYRPPELLFGYREYDSSLDMWAAGCTIAEMMVPEHQQLFDSGPLGSELGLIKSIFSVLGTPTEDSWPSSKKFPDWGKMRFKEYPAKPWDEVLPGVPDNGIDIVKKLVCYEPTARLSAEKALEMNH